MAWANFPVFAFGSLLVGIPILLHLLMKKRPRHQVFPALRFLRQRQIANKRQLRLRNWLLLALRIAAIGLLALVFSRPTVDSAAMSYWLRALLLGVLAPLAIVACGYCWLKQKGGLLVGSTGLASLLLFLGLACFLFRAYSAGASGNLGDANDPVAAVLVFDTSPRMGLKHQNKTRLDEAREMARQLMKQLPPESEIAVIDGNNLGAFSVDLGVAATTVDALSETELEFPLDELVDRGLTLVSSRDDKRKELYVFSEMSEIVWQADAFQSIRQRVVESQDVSLFVLDVGVEQPRNVQLGQLALSGDALPQGQLLSVETSVTSLNFAGEVDVEVSLEKPDATRPVMVDGKLLVPDLSPRSRSSYTLEEGGTIPISFQPIKGLQPGVHHGQVRVRSNDGLGIDDVRYFSINVRPAFPVLLVAFDGANPQATKQAISPDQIEREGRSAFECHVIGPKKLLSQQLDDYAVVALFDPDPMIEQQRNWKDLEDYVRRGGALILYLGRNTGTPITEFNENAKQLLPASLKRYWTAAKGTQLLISLQNKAHPMLALFRQGNVTWDESPIFRHWDLGELQPGASVIASYTNNEPFLVESILGKGRVVMMTTPVSDRRNDKNRPAWNDFPTADVPLPFFMLTRGMFDYLAKQSEPPWNYTVGQPVDISNETKQLNRAWQLVSPHGDWQNIRAENGSVVIASTEQVGTYRLKPTEPNMLGLGFSTNLPTQATQIARLDTTRLNDILGENNFTLARGTEELNRGIGRARVGRELFPFLIAVVVGLLALEHLLANRFYSNTSSPSATMKAAA